VDNNVELDVLVSVIVSTHSVEVDIEVSVSTHSVEVEVAVSVEVIVE